VKAAVGEPVIADATVAPGHDGQAVLVVRLRHENGAFDTVTLDADQARAVATIVPDESRISHVHTRVAGWVEQLDVNTTGEMVTAGQPLARIFSQELLSSQAEYLAPLTPLIRHLHISDASGTDGEGLQIGDGNVDFAALAPMLLALAGLALALGLASGQLAARWGGEELEAAAESA